MNVLDILLLVAAVWFAIVGYRQGFVVGILSVIGFLGGGLVAVYLLPVIWDALTDNAEVGTTAAVVAVVVVIVCASVGQALTTHLGNKLRRYITWSPARALDATGGALVNVVAMLLVAWLIGSALAGTTLPTLGKEVRSSNVLLGVARVLPDQADTWFADFSTVLAQNGFPQVFSPFADEQITDVDPPDPALANSPVATRAQRSIVKVMGTAQSCGKVLEGSGFVFGDRRVMTNAHVVGGVDEPTVQIGGEGRKYDATVVLYDWERDIAVLDVPDLSAPALKFASQDAARGDGAIVAGFPENGGTTFGPRACAGASRPTARTSTTAAPSAAMSIPSSRPSVRATPAARCSPPRARCTAWSSRSPSTAPRPVTRSPPTRSSRTSSRGAPRISRWTATAAHSEAGFRGTRPGRGSVRKRGVSPADDAGVPRPSGPGGAGCAECPLGDPCRPALPGHRLAGGSSGPRPSVDCVLRHCSRASSPYPDVCPRPKVDNRPQGPQLAYAPGNWPFVGQVFISGHGRSGRVTDRVRDP